LTGSLFSLVSLKIVSHEVFSCGHNNKNQFGGADGGAGAVDKIDEEIEIVP
jgi:hypothetical protein